MLFKFYPNILGRGQKRVEMPFGLKNVGLKLAFPNVSYRSD